MHAAVRSRIARLVFGLLATWCLGCQAFDPVLESVLEDYGEVAVAVRCADGHVQLQHDATEPAREIETPNHVACGHCLAIRPVTLFVVIPARLKLPPLDLVVAELPEVVRPPLVRPPIPA